MLILCAALLIGADVDPEPPGGSVKVIASADWVGTSLPPRRLDKHVVGRTPGELVNRQLDAVTAKEVTMVAAKAMNVKTIDWDKQMILVVAGGIQKSDGYRVEVVGMKIQGGTLKVSWKLNKAKNGGDDVITYPATAVLVPAYKGKVAFEQTK
jgi:hypothetical protein